MTSLPNKELCQKLYKLSMWDDLELSFQPEKGNCPLYTLEYILDKLPHMVTLPGLHYVGDTKENRFHLQMDKDAPDNSWVWSFYYLNGEETEFYSTSGDYEDTALNAALRLTIALFENGVLQKGTV